MSVIQHKYLGTNLNRLAGGPSSMLQLDNVRLDGSRLRSRKGQDLLIPQDPAFISIAGGTYQGYRCVKIWFYNNCVWGYFKQSGQYDILGYFNPTISPQVLVPNQWYGTILDGTGDPNVAFNVQSDTLAPQIAQSQKRLLLLSSLGVYCSPKLETDQQYGSGLSTYQTNIRPAGCPAAVPQFGTTLIDTTATYAANWMEDGFSSAYRHVWKYIDANGTLVYGAPSDRFVVQNATGSAKAVVYTLYIPVSILNSAQKQRYSCQIYRSLSTKRNAAGFFPQNQDQMFLVQQLRPTVGDLASGVLNFTDIIPDGMLQGPLYTNQTQQGQASARYQPPKSKAVADFSGCAWYGNITNRVNLPIQLVAVTDPLSVVPRGLQDGDIIILGKLALQAKASVAINANQFKLDTSAGIINCFKRVNVTRQWLCRRYNITYTRPQNFNLQSQSGTNDVSARMRLQGFDNTQEQAYVGLYRSVGWAGAGGSNPSPIVPSPLVAGSGTDVIGRGYKIIRIQCAGPGANLVMTLDSAPDFAVGDTCNVAQPAVFQDLTLPIGSRGDGINFTPGQYVCSSIVGNDVQFTNLIGGGVRNSQIGVAPFLTLWSNIGALHCVKSKSLGLQSSAVGKNQKFPARVMFSAFQEPQSAPLLNYIDVGDTDKAISKLFVVGQSLFVFKQDGLFRINGSYPQFSLQLFDRDIILVGPDLIASVGGAAYCMTTKGVYKITQNSAQRISYPIQNLIDPIIFNNTKRLKKLGFAVGNGTDQSVTFWLPNYTLSTKTASTQCDIGFVFDGQGWSTRSDKAVGACCGINTRNPDDKYSLYTMKGLGSGWLTKQRSKFSGLDSCDQSISRIAGIGGLTSVSGYVVELDLGNDSGPTSVIPQVFKSGSVIVPYYASPDYTLRAITVGAPTFVSGTTWRFTVTFVNPATVTSDWTANLGFTIYAPIYHTWQYGINFSQTPQNRKHFSQIGFLFQQPYFSSADIQFTSDVAPLRTTLVDNLKGFMTSATDPTTWPLLGDDQNLSQKTIRALVDSNHQRCSQLRVRVVHKRAMQFISCYGYFVKSSQGGKNIERSNG